jgi:ADP-heptose:LPS heptosyltransferase
LAAWLARVPIRVGTGYRWYSFLFNRKVYEHRKTAEHHEAEYNLRMLSHIGVSADMNCLPEIQLRPAEIIAVDEWRAETLGAASAGYVVLHTVCGGSTMEWPSEWFVELGRQLRERLACAIVLTGVEADRAKLSAMADAMNAQRVPFKGPPALFVGYPLTQLAALLAGAKAVVSVGTGPGHLAAALGTPSVGLFPLPHAISKERWGLRGKRAVKNVSPEPIAGCPDCKSCTCMERISVERVVMEVMNLAGPGARFG